MEKLEAAGRSTLRLAWLGAAAAVALLLLLLADTERDRRKAYRQAMRAEVGNSVSLLAAELQGVIDRNIQLVQGLVAVVNFEPGIDQERFARLGAQVLHGASEVRNIAAAPDLIIRRVHPLEGNEAVVGVDYRDLPQQLPSVLRARDLGVTVLAGPLDLIQGGQGFVARSPVFVDDGAGRERRFWGVISTVIDPDKVYAAAGLDAPELGIDVVLSGRDGVTGGPTFRGDPAILGRDPVVAKVTLPFGAWQIAAIPDGGWSPPPPPWELRALFALAALLVTLPIVGAGRAADSRRRRVAVIREREAELSRLSWRLELALTA
jgi:sensor domain CHASE-containing protein